MYALIVYRPSTQELLLCREYPSDSDGQLALGDRFHEERNYGKDVEVVVIGASGMDVIRALYSRYFATGYSATGATPDISDRDGRELG